MSLCRNLKMKKPPFQAAFAQKELFNGAGFFRIKRSLISEVAEELVDVLPKKLPEFFKFFPSHDYSSLKIVTNYSQAAAICLLMGSFYNKIHNMSIIFKKLKKEKKPPAVADG